MDGFHQYAFIFQTSWGFFTRPVIVETVSVGQATFWRESKLDERSKDEQHRARLETFGAWIQRAP